MFLQTQPSKPDARIIQAHTRWTEDVAKVNAVDTVVVDSSGKEIDPSEAEGLVARPLPRTERVYYRQEGDEEAAPRKPTTGHSKASHCKTARPTTLTS